jgi:hypothetical protein
MRSTVVFVALLSISCAGPTAEAESEAPTQSMMAAEAPASAVPVELVETAGKASGVQKAKIRVDDTGAVTKLAIYHADADRIPQPVRDLARKTYPEAKVKVYESEYYAERGVVFEVEVETKDGKECEVEAKSDGTLVYTECVVDAASLSAEVKATIDETVPGAKVLEVEEKKGPDIDEVIVEVEKDGQAHVLTMKPSGELVSHHLRIPAVLDVPAG